MPTYDLLLLNGDSLRLIIGLRFKNPLYMLLVDVEQGDDGIDADGAALPEVAAAGERQPDVGGARVVRGPAAAESAGGGGGGGPVRGHVRVVRGQQQWCRITVGPVGLSGARHAGSAAAQPRTPLPATRTDTVRTLQLAACATPRQVSALLTRQRAGGAGQPCAIGVALRPRPELSKQPLVPAPHCRT